MPTKKAGATSQQILIRLPTEHAEVLSALAFLRGTSATEIVRDEIVAFLESAASGERIQRLIRERAEFKAEEAGKLRSIRPAANSPDT